MRKLLFRSDLASLSSLHSSSVHDALDKFSLTSGRPLVIVDDNNKLIGTLSSGDIRRYLHSSQSVDLTTVTCFDICNLKPVFFSADHDYY